MPYDFILPDLGEGITEGEIRQWFVKEGDSIEEHQAVLELETDKAVVEVPSPKKGKVAKINKAVGDMVAVGEVLMVIAEEGEGVPSRPKSVSVVGVLPEAEEEVMETKSRETQEAPVLATPAVRARAKELGVNLETLKGSGPGGSITLGDVEAASSAPAKGGIQEQYGTVERTPLKGLRKTIARNLMAAHQHTAFVTGMEEADITELGEIREREKKKLKDRGVELTFLPFFLKAAQHALVEHPLLNASVDEEKEEIIVKKYYNLGVAVDTPEGLMVPVIKDVDKKTILELAMELNNLGRMARERKIKLEDLRGGTFTISNYGHFGSTFATPIINYPEVAILGTGRIMEKPWVKDGQVVVRKILPLSLTFDHRVTDGVDAARFMTKVVQYLEDPALLFLESA